MDKKSNLNELVQKNKVLLLLIAIGLIVTITSFSYAYFAATVNTGTVYDTVVTTGSMELLFTDGEVIGTPTGLVPGQSFKKRFKVKNTGSLATTYTIYMIDVANSFNPASEFKYRIDTVGQSSGYSTESGEYVTCPTANDSIIVNQSINSLEEQEYEITFLFEETGENQDLNKGKSFTARLSLNDPQAPSLASQVSYTPPQSAGNTTCTGANATVQCSVTELYSKLSTD